MSEHKRHFCYAPACERISLLPLPGHKSFENRECFSHMHTRTRIPTKIIALFKECVSELLIFLSYFWTKIGRRLKKANDFFVVVAEHLLWMRTDVLCMWTRVWASWTVHQCIQLARVCVCEHVRVTSGARWNTMLIGWRSVGEFEADWPRAGLLLLSLAHSHPWLGSWFSGSCTAASLHHFIWPSIHG